MPKKKQEKQQVTVTLTINEEGRLHIKSDLSELHTIHFLSTAQQSIIDGMFERTDKDVEQEQQ